jgi:hypothetical protein
MYEPLPQSVEYRQIYQVDDGIPSSRTGLRYRSAFSLFMRNFSLEDSDLPSLIHKHPRLIEAQIIDYIRFLAEKKHYTRGSISAAIAAVYHFFEMNDVLLNKRKINRFLPEDESDCDLLLE